MEDAVRPLPIHRLTGSVKEEPTMFDWKVANTIQTDRVREIDRRMQIRRWLDGQSTPETRSFRRRIGRELIRIGSALAADAPLQPAAR